MKNSRHGLTTALVSTLALAGLTACGNKSSEASAPVRAGVSAQPAAAQVTSDTAAKDTVLVANSNAAQGQQRVPKAKTPGQPGLGTLAATTPGLGTLAQLATLCGLVPALNDASASLTVFAPTDAAFAAFLGDAPVPQTCTDEVKTILSYHVLPARVLSSDLKEKQAVPTLAGSANKVFVTSGVEGVVVNGGSKVVQADVLASNGVAHVVDRVLVPDALGTVVDAAAKRYDFTSLVGAVAAAGLVEALSTAESVTVFAPTNGAFAKLAVVPNGSGLVKVLTHHVAPTAILARQLVRGTQKVDTLEGSQLTIKVDAHGRGFIFGSGETAQYAGRIVATDIVTSNGVIHAIDEVLIPAGL
jgi:transforming growth factor-beta-induced protein